MKDLLLAIEAENNEWTENSTLDVYVIGMGEAAKKKAVELTYELTQNNITAEMDYLDRKMKTQMKSADRLKAKYVLVIGDDELEKESAMLKDLATGTQQLSSI